MLGIPQLWLMFHPTWTGDWPLTLPMKQQKNKTKMPLEVACILSHESKSACDCGEGETIQITIIRHFFTVHRMPIFIGDFVCMEWNLAIFIAALNGIQCTYLNHHNNRQT